MTQMTIKPCFFILLIVGQLAHSQDKIWTKQTRICEIISFEKTISPESQYLDFDIGISRDYYPLADRYKLTRPLIVLRPAIGYLPVYAQYFFTQGDSILRLVSYDWEKERFGDLPTKRRIWEEEDKKSAIYNKEYEKIREILVAQLGTPTDTDEKAKENSGLRGDYLTRDTVWDTNELFATLNLTFSGTIYRIRMVLYWKK
jgi:hypothetical protein